MASINKTLSQYIMWTQTFYAIKLLFPGTVVTYTQYFDFVFYETNASLLKKETVIFLEILVNTC